MLVVKPTSMNQANLLKINLLLATCLIFYIDSFSQTSWRGTSSTSWNTAANWTNGVPTAAVDAIIGDASILTTRYPTISNTATCKSLTIGGAYTAKLTANKNLTVLGSITLNANGTLIQGNHNVISAQGNWTMSGTY